MNTLNELRAKWEDPAHTYEVLTFSTPGGGLVVVLQGISYRDVGGPKLQIDGGAFHVRRYFILTEGDKDRWEVSCDLDNANAHEAMQYIVGWLPNYGEPK